MSKSTTGSTSIAVSRRQLLALAAASSAVGSTQAATGEVAPAPKAAPGSTVYRIGILGSAGIVERALLTPAKEVPEIAIEAIGSRTAARGREYADKHGIPRALDYEAVVHDPAIDIVYVPLPVALHAEWSIKAMEAGKHVLCEKTMTANGDEAAKVAAVARRTGRVFMEAYHYPYHPYARRVRDLLDTRAIGAIKSVEANMDIPDFVTGADNIRRQFELGGGSMIDAGCYALHGLCDILGDAERVTSAKAVVDKADPQIDMTMDATLAFAGGRTGKIHTSFLGGKQGVMNVTVHGTAGTLSVDSLFVPQWGGSLRMEWGGRTYTEKADVTPSYVFQLRELVRCIRDGAPVLTSADNGVALMRTIDAIYTKAGLKRRGTA
jgi:predicted dehydrogenase